MPNYWVLSACVHGGKVQEGRHYSDTMRNVYGIMPRLQPYRCLVDLLGRAGLLKEVNILVVFKFRNILK